MWLYLHLLPLQLPCFQIRSHSEILGLVRTSHVFFGRHSSTRNIHDFFFNIVGLEILFRGWPSVTLTKNEGSLTGYSNPSNKEIMCLWKCAVMKIMKKVKLQLCHGISEGLWAGLFCVMLYILFHLTSHCNKWKCRGAPLCITLTLQIMRFSQLRSAVGLGFGTDRWVLRALVCPSVEWELYPQGRGFKVWRSRCWRSVCHTWRARSVGLALSPSPSSHSLGHGERGCQWSSWSPSRCQQ